MGDINRVYAQIDGFFAAGGQERVGVLIKLLEHHSYCALRGFYDSQSEDKAVKERVEGVRDKIASIKTAELPTDINALTSYFCSLTNEVMIARRAVLPLDHPTMPLERLDPGSVIYDDNDMHSFAIYDTIADEIAAQLPPLHQIAVESSWDPKHRRS